MGLYKPMVMVEEVGSDEVHHNGMWDVGFGCRAHEKMISNQVGNRRARGADHVSHSHNVIRVSCNIWNRYNPVIQRSAYF